MELYFAYGSNLSLKQMRKRCPSTQFAGIATLRGWRLWFPLVSKIRWGGGVASIKPEPDSRVEGVLYSISWDDLQRMDGFEGVDIGMYERHELEVLAAGEMRRAWSYIGRIEAGAPFDTTRAYMDTILEGAIEHGLSPDWISYLHEFPISDNA